MCIRRTVYIFKFGVVLFSPYLDFRFSLVVWVCGSRIFTHQKIYLHLGFNNNENDLISYYCSKTNALCKLQHWLWIGDWKKSTGIRWVGVWSCVCLLEELMRCKICGTKIFVFQRKMQIFIHDTTTEIPPIYIYLHVLCTHNEREHKHKPKHSTHYLNEMKRISRVRWNKNSSRSKSSDSFRWHFFHRLQVCMGWWGRWWWCGKHKEAT